MALTDNLISVWHTNNDWQDSWGTNHGTATGATFSTSSKLGSHAGSFDGVDDKVAIAANASLDLSGEVSIMSWFNADTLDTANGNVIFGKYAPVHAYLISTTGSPKIQFSLWFSATQYYVFSSTVLSTGGWYQVVGTRLGTAMKIYLNGIYEATVACPAGAFNATSGGLEIGRADSNANCHDGLIDELAIWSRALTDGGVAVGQTAGGEVAELWNGGAGIEIGAAAAASVGQILHGKTLKSLTMGRLVR